MYSTIRSIFAAAACLGAAAQLASAQQTMYAIGNGGSALVRFRSDSPASATVVATFNGAATFLDALAFRPATGQLYGYLDSADAFYLVNTTTGALTLDSVGASAAPTNTFFLGLAFNPAVDKARIVTDSAQNIVFDPAAHTVSAATTLAYAKGDPNVNTSPAIIENAYTPNRAGATDQYGIDYGVDALVRIANNAGTLTTVGPLGVDTNEFVGFDIATSPTGTDVGYAILTPTTAVAGGAGGPALYTIDLASGRATRVGALGVINQVYGLAIAPGAGSPGGPAADGAGVCCISGLTCAIATAETCRNNKGAFQGSGSTCSPANPCTPVLGACCLPPRPPSNSGVIVYPNQQPPGVTGSCFATTLASCTFYSGTFQGNTTTCTPTLCPQATPTMGACCSLSSSLQPICRQDTADGCASTFATFTGVGVACTAAACPQPALGACCRIISNYAICTFTSQASCTQAAGTFSAACTPTSCPQPTLGACCSAATTVRGSSCTVMYSSSCTAPGTTFSAASSTCQASPCTRSCPCDYNFDGQLTALDVVQFTNAYLSGNADFDSNGVTNAQDYNAFTSCYYSSTAGCFR